MYEKEINKKGEWGYWENLWKIKLVYVNLVGGILSYRRGKSRFWNSEDIWKLRDGRKEIEVK